MLELKDITVAFQDGQEKRTVLDHLDFTAKPGETFLDRMISLVEGAERQKTPNEIALSLVLSAFTLIFLIVVVALAQGRFTGLFRTRDAR